LTTRLADSLGDNPLSTSVVLHVNHPAEVCTELAAALTGLRARGVALLNQSVLLAGVNDDADTLQALSEALFDVGVMPYYVHLLDRVAGAAHFGVDDGRASALQSALQARLPGYLVPRFVREHAGGTSKTPLAMM
jgi:L-lysine 2,3-aminomutase